MIAEEWRSITGFPDYTINPSGEVISYKGRQPRLLRQSSDGHGYKFVSLCAKNLIQKKWIHILVAEVFVGPRPEGMEVRHLDGDKTNNRADNLAYGTSAENKRDQVRHGTHANARKTRCRNGHEYNDRNTYVGRYNGWVTRTCRICNAAAQRRRKERLALRAAGVAA